jgi:MFS family permease
VNRPTRWYDYISINIYWFALTTRSQVLTPLVVPLLVQRFVGESLKGTYVGRIRLWSLMVALLIQALMGLLSDRGTARLGRRRPFVLWGAVGEAVVLILIGAVASLEGLVGYWVFFAIIILSMVASNAAHAATQGLIPDLVPLDQCGRFSGFKALLELPVPLVFTSFVVADMVAAGNLWGALFSVIAVILVCAAVTMVVPERPLAVSPGPMDWQPLLRLALMTAIFTSVILGTGAVAGAGMRWAADLSGLAARWTIAAIGVLAMALAILAGVWISVSVGLGQDAAAHRSFTWWVISRLAFLVAANNFAGFMLYFLQERYVELAGERAAGPAARVMMFVGIAIMLTALPSGWLSDRFGKRLLVVLSSLIAAAGTLVILLVPSMAALYAGGSLIGAAMGLFFSASWALGTAIVPEGQAGRFLGLSNLAGAGAGAIGAYIGGPIADANGYVFLFAIYGVMFLLAVPAMAGVREIRGPTPAQRGPRD